jgi:hypothetical protein
MQKKHRKLCYEYKNAIFLEEVAVRYATICYWWYFLNVANEARFQELENWHNF